jgi:TPR repeat protein
VCFACGEVRFVAGNRERLSGIAAFDAAAKVELLRLTKALFPNDFGNINKSADAEGRLREAQDLESRGEIENAIRAYRRAARAGSAKAANRLGEIYETGMPGVSRDPAEARSWRDAARSLGG